MVKAFKNISILAFDNFNETSVSCYLVRENREFSKQPYMI